MQCALEMEVHWMEKYIHLVFVLEGLIRSKFLNRIYNQPLPPVEHLCLLVVLLRTVRPEEITSG
jgi:hypothetical protein